MRERQERELDLAVQDRFRNERHPEQSVDGDDPYELNLYGCPCGQPGCPECDPYLNDNELPGMWERADFEGGRED